MYLASRSLYRAGLLVAVAAAVFTFGCKKKTVRTATSAAGREARAIISHGDVAGQPGFHQQR